MQSIYLERIKAFEGFTAQAKFDYAQYSNGYGTKALHPGEMIDRGEAERRFQSEIQQARQFVDRHAAGWDEGTKAALTSLTFNAGTRWATSGLGEAVRSGDLAAVRERFLAYNKAGGQELAGLAKRRMAEAEWMGRQVLQSSANPTSRAGANPVEAIPTSATCSVPRLESSGLVPSVAQAPTMEKPQHFEPGWNSPSAERAAVSVATASSIALLAMEAALELREKREQPEKEAVRARQA